MIKCYSKWKWFSGFTALFAKLLLELLDKVGNPYLQ